MVNASLRVRTGYLEGFKPQRAQLFFSLRFWVLRFVKTTKTVSSCLNMIRAWGDVVNLIS